ncbi:Nucleic acid-binding, OB-fold [Sesbania bispinosa]|nr:Nucleic acid-binding, OB-fold [Sesbania bispinosa]
MVSAAFHKINSICGRRQNWHLKVKLVRAWNMCVVATPCDPYAIQMVFVDEEGGKIEAIVQKQYMNKFADCMVEGEVYRITKFGVCTNGGKFRAVGHDYELLFTSCTKVTLCQGVNIAGLGLSLKKTTDIKKTKGFSRYLVDKVELLTFVSCEGDYMKDEKDITTLFLELTDPTGKIECVLYDEYVEDLRDAGIESVIGVTRVLLYPDIPEVFQMNHWYSLKVEVSNDKDATYLILGDEDVESLVHVSCKDLLSSMHTRSTIVRLLGEQGVAEHFNHLDGSSYASAIPADNFTSDRSFHAEPSSSASAAFNNMATNISNEEESYQPIYKECVHFTSNNE